MFVLLFSAYWYSQGWSSDAFNANHAEASE